MELGRTAATRCPTGTRSWWCLPPQQISALQGLLTAVLLVIKRSCIYFTPRAKGLGSEAELDLAERFRKWHQWKPWTGRKPNPNSSAWCRAAGGGFGAAVCTSKASPRNPAYLLHHPPDILGESNSLAACWKAAASINKRSCLLQKQPCERHRLGRGCEVLLVSCHRAGCCSAQGKSREEEESEEEQAASAEVWESGSAPPSQGNASWGV